MNLLFRQIAEDLPANNAGTARYQYCHCISPKPLLAYEYLLTVDLSSALAAYAQQMIFKRAYRGGTGELLL
jgi:hypothetical protein